MFLDLYGSKGWVPALVLIVADILSRSLSDLI